ncbi:MAG: ribosomal protein L7/L12 [Acidobacteriales bacterium]|nr:ribosomal protein L7/L12 [Terriglobales bacterium]
MAGNSRLTVQPLGDELLYWLHGECIFRHQNDGKAYPINVIKAIREHTPLDLKSAKEIWDARVTDSVAPKERLVRGAAPELLEALKACKRELEYWIESAREVRDCPLQPDADDAEALSLARAAIAKAEGR